MSLKKNLLKKIKIESMSKKVLASIGPRDSGAKIDKETMRHLLEMAACKYTRKRDLDLYILETEKDSKKILVLDNDLAVYHTTAGDVALRKSPMVKEMLSIRNIIKIINDADVVISKREESIKTVRKKCVDRLDLSFEKSDIDAIENEGIGSLEGGDAAGVLESLSLFAELLGYSPPPRAFMISNHKVIGALAKEEGGETFFGPLVIYSTIYNLIKLIDEPINSLNKEKIEFVHQVALGKEKAVKEGPFVFQYLKEMVLKQNNRVQLLSSPGK